MAKKRKDVKRSSKGGGRGRPGCLSVFFLVIFVVAALTSTIAIFFKINHITVIGNERYTAEQIRTSAGVEQDSNLILLNIFEKTSNIFAKLPYVDEVKMMRRLPDTLVIEIKECVEVASFSEKGAFWLISKDGKVLERVRELPEDGLIRIRGADLINPEPGKKADIGGEEDDGEMRLQALVETLRAITEQGIEKDVKELNIEKVYNVELNYLGRFIVKLGIPEHLDYKIDCLEEVVGYLSPSDRGIIDLTELIDKKPARFIPGEIDS